MNKKIDSDIIYSLTFLHNDSTIQETTFAAFSSVPIDAQNPFSVAWLTHSLYPTHFVTFYWKLDWSFAYAATGFDEGIPWNAGGYFDTNPESPDTCSVKYYYSGGDFNFEPDYAHKPSPQYDTLWIDDDTSVSGSGVPASSVGLCVKTTGASASPPNSAPRPPADDYRRAPVIAAPASANFIQTFTLHPTYYVTIGNYSETAMVSMSSVLPLQQVTYEGANHDMTAELTTGNVWKVYPSKQARLPIA
ncbi:hypothetical protein [Saccharopolyspora spinosa]|nr:hypothetical protein [Saccharopolyspora spinosa]